MGPEPAGTPQLEYLFSRLVCISVPLGYTILLVILVIAGIKYLTSGGEPKAVQAAHQTVTWGLLGVLFLAIAWLILQLIQNFTGVEVTKFSLSSLPGVQGFTGSCWESPPIPPNPTPAPVSQQQTSNVTQKQPTTHSVSPACNNGDKYNSAFVKGNFDQADMLEYARGNKRSPIPNEYCRYLEDHQPYNVCMVPCNQVEFYLVKTNIRTNIMPYDIELRSTVPAYVKLPYVQQALQEFKGQYGQPQVINTMEEAVSDVIWVGGGCPEADEILSKMTFGGLNGDVLRFAREKFSVEGGPWAKFPKDTLPLRLIEANRQRNEFSALVRNLVTQPAGPYGFSGISPVIYGLSCSDADYYSVGVIGP